MAQVYCTGPVHAAAKPPSGGILYIGTSERGARISTTRHFSPVMNDIGGIVLPFDVMYQGTDAYVSLRLTRFNHANILVLESALGGTAGEDAAGDIGTIIAQEEQNTELYLVFAYATKGTMDGMPAGYHFLVANWEPEQMETGTGNEVIDMTWHCTRKHVDGKMMLYDYDVAGVQTE